MANALQPIRLTEKQKDLLFTLTMLHDKPLRYITTSKNGVPYLVIYIYLDEDKFLELSVTSGKGPLRRITTKPDSFELEYSSELDTTPEGVRALLDEMKREFRAERAAKAKRRATTYAANAKRAAALAVTDAKRAATLAKKNTAIRQAIADKHGVSLAKVEAAYKFAKDKKLPQEHTVEFLLQWAAMK